MYLKAGDIPHAFGRDDYVFIAVYLGLDLNVVLERFGLHFLDRHQLRLSSFLLVSDCAISASSAVIFSLRVACSFELFQLGMLIATATTGIEHDGEGRQDDS